MSGFKILSAAAMLSLMIATPAFAQAAVQEPGAAAFYHPNADILHTGRPLPAEAAGAMASVPFGGRDAYAAMDSNASDLSCAQRYRSYDPASGTFLGYDGARHTCQ
jgi:BA14K-like protein